MSESKTTTAATPIWVDISTSDPKAAQAFYGKLFDWETEDLGEEAGNYGFFKNAGRIAAGVGPTQMPGQPSAWMVYIGTDDADAVAAKITEVGGKVIAPPMDVFDTGRMAVFQDTTGAFISVWQPGTMPGLGVSDEPNSFDWAELSARGIDAAKDFYGKVFGWGVKETPMGEDQGMYTEWQLDGKSIAGAMEMSSMVPEQVPSYWMPYFKVADIDAAHRSAVDLGGASMMQPTPFPGGRFAIVSDPQGAVFGLTGE